MTYVHGRVAERKAALEAAQAEIRELRELRALEQAVLDEFQAEVAALARIRLETERARQLAEETRKANAVERSMRRLPPPMYGGTAGLVAAADEIDQWNKRRKAKKVSIYSEESN